MKTIPQDRTVLSNVKGWMEDSSCYLCGPEHQHLTQQKFKSFISCRVVSERRTSVEKRVLSTACPGAHCGPHPCPAPAVTAGGAAVPGTPGQDSAAGPGCSPQHRIHVKEPRQQPETAAAFQTPPAAPTGPTAPPGLPRYLGGHGGDQLEEVRLHGLGPAPLAGQEQRLGRLGAAALPPHAQHGRARHGAQGRSALHRSGPGQFRCTVCRA